VHCIVFIATNQEESMNTLSARQAAIALLFAGAAFAQNASAVTQSANFDHLTESATFSTPLLANDSLFLNTLVTSETGALTQTITFTLGASVAGLTGNAVWDVTTAAGPGPRLIGVDINIFDAANNLVTTDGSVVLANGFATSTFASAIGPGTYKLVATGTGVRDSSLDVSLSFTPAVPEPETYALMLAGLGIIGVVGSRRRQG
jgi:hypothetical protein